MRIFFTVMLFTRLGDFVSNVHLYFRINISPSFIYVNRENNITAENTRLVISYSRLDTGQRHGLHTGS